MATIGGAFGAGKAGGAFDPIEFIKRPQVILRCVSVVSFPLFITQCVYLQIGF